MAANKLSPKMQAVLGNRDQPVTADETERVKKVYSRILTRLTDRIPFFARLLLALRLNVSRKPLVACVSRDRNLYLNPDWVLGSSEPEVTTVLVHEVLHPAMLFWERMGTRNLMAIGNDGVPVPLWCLAHDFCFHAGAIVGGVWRSIEEIQSGATVIGQNGLTETVSPMSRKYEGEMVKVKALGLEPFSCTPDHRVLTFRRRNMRRYPIRMTDEPEWVAVGDLQAKEHYLCVPRLKGHLDTKSIDLRPYCKKGRWGDGNLGHAHRSELPLNRDTAWLMGVYVAEGDSAGDQVRWTLNENEKDFAERIQSICRNLSYSPGVVPIPERHGQRVVLGSSLISRLFREVCGSGAKNKRIPDCILYHTNVDLVRSFLDGYHQGDGWPVVVGEGREPNDGKEAGTSSHILALQLQMAWSRLGRLAKLYLRPQKDRYIRGRFIPGGVPFWWISAHEGKASTRVMNNHQITSVSHSWRVLDDYILTPVKSVEATLFSGVVYNVETKDNTYTVSNAVVHNCINQIIREMHRSCSDPSQLVDISKIDPPGLIDDKYIGWSAEEVYDDILSTALANSDGDGDGDGLRILVPGCDASKDDTSDSGEGEGEKELTEQEKRALDRSWKLTLVEAARIHERQRGTLPAGIKKLVDEITDPRLPWRDVLSRWVGENGRRADFTWQRPSRRSESVGELLPSLRKHGITDLVVLWDTSGSMNGRETEVLSEVIGISQDLNLGLRVICCDAAIHSDQEGVESPDDVDVKGGGGSDFKPAFDKLVDENYEAIVVAFTDGHIGVPKVKPGSIKDVLWCIWPSEKGDRDPTDGKWGECIRVDEDGYVKKLKPAA